MGLFLLTVLMCIAELAPVVCTGFRWG
jgi:hypothetical protein